jgi:hypothetical protein
MIKNTGCDMGRKYTVRRPSCTEDVTCKKATRNVHTHLSRRRSEHSILLKQILQKQYVV